MSTTTVDWKKVRQELRTKRTEVFDRFVKDPSKIRLAIEVKLLDDELLECAEHLQRERQAEE